MDQLEDFVRNVLGVEDEALVRNAMKIGYFRHVRKGEYLVKSGDHVTELCFLVRGLFRFFFLDCKGREVTDRFCFRQGSGVVPAADIYAPWQINIVALEDSQVLVLPMQVTRKYLRSNIEVAHLYNRLLIAGLTEHNEVKMALYQYSATERYEWFLRRYEGLIDRVPHVHIASFLGINPVTMSRLRGKLREKNKSGK